MTPETRKALLEAARGIAANADFPESVRVAHAQAAVRLQTNKDDPSPYLGPARLLAEPTGSGKLELHGISAVESIREGTWPFTRTRTVFYRATGEVAFTVVAHDPVSFADSQGARETRKRGKK